MSAFEKGTTRNVLLTKEVVLKVPNFKHARNFTDLILDCIEYGDLKSCIKYLFASEEYVGGFVNGFLNGILVNMREFCMYLTCDSTLKEIIVPTRFSLSGLLNIQDKCITNDNDDLLPLFKEILGVEMVNRYGHFFRGKNFGFHQGKYKCLDYGGRSEQDIFRDKKKVAQLARALEYITKRAKSKSIPQFSNQGVLEFLFGEKLQKESFDD